MRIAMWSGPRNLSTAMMYSFAQRADFHVMDEPFYGPYLRETGLDHPMREAILKSRSQTAVAVEQSLIGPIPNGKPHVYHKHMCQHMIDGMPRGFMAECVNVFLIRHPARVAASFLKGYPDATPEDLGFRLQAALFDHALALGQQPIVIDSSDIRTNPEGMLRKLCDAIGIRWDPAMLSWPMGGNPADGVWAAHWYDAVHRSTGFAGAEGALPDVSSIQYIVDACQPYYDALAAVRVLPLTR